MNRRFVLLLTFVLLSASALRAEAVCPWLTQGSAAAMLGGDVSTIIRLATTPGEGSCAFSLHQGAATYSLDVVVESTPPHTTCPPASPKVPGIGNEAVVCHLQRSPNESAQVVTSRVRTLYFTVSLTTQGTVKPGIPLDNQKDIVQRAAEQVAGNLF
jgi:hypothetical protein